MGKVAETNDIEAILALGDTHHYMGIESIDDPLWMTNYELIYNHPELQIPWYPILGNHEYRGNTQAVIEYSNRSRRWQMPSRYYSKVFEGDSTTLRVVFIDTTPLIDKYHSDAADYPSVTTQDINAQLAWLEKELLEAPSSFLPLFLGFIYHYCVAYSKLGFMTHRRRIHLRFFFCWFCLQQLYG